MSKFRKISLKKGNPKKQYLPHLLIYRWYFLIQLRANSVSLFVFFGSILKEKLRNFPKVYIGTKLSYWFLVFAIFWEISFSFRSNIDCKHSFSDANKSFTKTIFLLKIKDEISNFMELNEISIVDIFKLASLSFYAEIWLSYQNSLLTNKDH